MPSAPNAFAISRASSTAVKVRLHADVEVALNLKAQLAEDNPNLLMARRRLLRTQRLWALLLGAMGVLSYGLLRFHFPLAFLPWVVAAVLVALKAEPIALALTGLLWGLSLANLNPGVAALLGPDPLTLLFGSGTLELIVIVLIRLVIVVTALNQFFMYRMLYGTEGMSGLDPDLADIPMVISNRSNAYALISRALGILSLAGNLAAAALMETNLGLQVLGLSVACGVFAIGLGLGSAFSPTQRRGAALMGIGFGAVAYLMAIAIGRVL
jgi:hypothetical protein